MHGSLSRSGDTQPYRPRQCPFPLATRPAPLAVETGESCSSNIVPLREGSFRAPVSLPAHPRRLQRHAARRNLPVATRSVASDPKSDFEIRLVDGEPWTACGARRAQAESGKLETASPRRPRRRLRSGAESRDHRREIERNHRFAPSMSSRCSRTADSSQSPRYGYVGRLPFRVRAVTATLNIDLLCTKQVASQTTPLCVGIHV